MIRAISLVIVAVAFFATSAPGADSVPEAMPAGQLLAKITFKSASKGLDAAGRKAIDAVLADIQKQGNETFICLQGHSGTGKNKNDYVKRSLNLAREVDNYLRNNKSVSVELYLATQDDKIPPRRGDYVNILVYPLQFKEETGFIQ